MREIARVFVGQLQNNGCHDPGNKSEHRLKQGKSKDLNWRV